MSFETEFKDIRPFNNSEVTEAIELLISDPNFNKVSHFFHPDKRKAIQTLRTIKTIEDFQTRFSNSFLNHIIETTSDGLTSSGVEEIKGKGHLYIANHRDIILDTAFLQLMLQRNNIPTTEITVGDNLMKNSLFKILGKLNKVFTLKREGTRIEMYNNFILHAKYINQVIRVKNESLWIAQRDGRTKDGDDKTQQGLLKMVLGDRKDIIPALQELAIVPVSTSYELEPCLKSKIRETYITSKGEEYVKSKDEDMHSVATSTLAPKGRIHIGFGQRLNLVFQDTKLDKLSNNEIINLFVEEIDKQIYKNYKLWPFNYVAFDSLASEQQFSDKYNNKDVELFEKYINKAIADIKGDKNKLKEIAYHIYANPVKNKLSIQ